MNGVGIATRDDFGAESSRPASLLCTLRTHQSPGEWQHSLPACSLALTGRDFHPLDSIEWFHLFISASPLLSFPSATLPVSFSLCFEHVEHWERIASRGRPAFSSHLGNEESGNLN